jgi:hypothetical protein
MKTITDPTLAHCINSALQSNFQLLSSLTDAGGLFSKIDAALEAMDNNELKEKLETSKLRSLIQATYTGRCLGAALTPDASKHTDVRSHVREALSELNQTGD